MNKQVFTDKNRVVKIIKYPDDIMLYSIAKQHGKIADKVISGLTNVISAAHRRSDFFFAIMYNDKGESIGCANFIQNSSKPSKWFYTDLWIAPEHRRQGCATELVSTACKHLSELNAKTLICTVVPQNEASLHLQRSLGFEQIETEPFEDFEVDDLIMFKMNIGMNFNIIPLKDDFNHLDFICELLTNPSNVSALHLNMNPGNERRQFYKDIRETLIVNATDNESNYIVRKGVVPIAWLGLNELKNDSLRINMLIVYEKYRNLGAGMYALNFAHEFALSTHRKHIYVNTPKDNLIAQSLYKKAGYIALEETNHQNEDKTEVVRYIWHKEIFFD